MFPLESRGITQMASQHSLQKIPQSHLKLSALGLGSKDEITIFCSPLSFPHYTAFYKGHETLLI